MQATSVLESFRGGQALTKRGNHSLLGSGSTGIVLSVSQDLHRVAELSFAEQQKSLATGNGRATVVGRLGRHIGKVDAFVKHVAVDWCLWGRDAQTLPENTSVVCSTRAMPVKSQILESRTSVRVF